MEVSRWMAAVVPPQGAVARGVRRAFGGAWRQRALLVVAGAGAAGQIAGMAATADRRYVLVGVLDDGVEAGGAVPGGVPVLGRIADLVRVARETGADAIILAGADWDDPGLGALLLLAGRVPAEMLVTVPEGVAAIPDVTCRVVAGQRVIRVGIPPIWGAAADVKRAVDLVLASVLLVLLAPVLLLVAVAIKVESPGPVLFRQRRYGFNKRVFALCKFRTMAHAAADPAASVQTARNDVRLTRLGAILRRHSLDELPQLLNVLSGDMSIVGPRPHALGTTTGGVLLEEALDLYGNRYRVPPGITGWAQVNGSRGELSTIERLRQRVEFDLYYIDNWTLALDLRILVMTVRCVWNDAHAY